MFVDAQVLPSSFTHWTAECTIPHTKLPLEEDVVALKFFNECKPPISIKHGLEDTFSLKSTSL